MRNRFLKIALGVPAIAAILFMGIPSLTTMAQPSAGPTGGNVDANFSSVTATSSTGMGVQGNTTAGGGYAGVQGIGTTYGVSGIGTGVTGFGGSFNGGNTGVYGTVSGASGIGVRGDGKGSGAGVAGYNNDAVANATGLFGRALSATGYGARLEGGFYGLLADAATAGGTGGWFRDFTGTNTAKLGTSTAAVDATGVIKNAGLTIDSNGDLSDSTGAVVINDNNGFQIIGGNPLSGVVGLQFTPVFSNDIAISAPQAGERVFINDAEGMDIRGPIRNWGAGTTPLKFDDDQGIQVTDGAGTPGLAISVTGDITNPGPNTAAYNYGAVGVEDKLIVNDYTEINSDDGGALWVYSYDNTSTGAPAFYAGAYESGSGPYYSTAIVGDGYGYGVVGMGETAMLADGYEIGLEASGGYTSSPSIGVKATGSWNAPGSIGVQAEGRAGVYAVSNAPSSGGQGVYGESSPYSSNGVGVDGRGGNGTYTGVGLRGTGVGAGSQGGQMRYQSVPAGAYTNVVDLSTPSYAINAGGTVRTYGTNNAMRLTGTGSYTSGATLNLGDGDYVHISEPVDDAIEIKSNNFNVTPSNGVNIPTPTGYNIGLDVAGRIRSGNGPGGTGGMWVGGSGGGQFFGSKDSTYAGIYNNGYWGLTTNYWGNSQTSGVLTTGGGIISQAGLMTTTNIYALGSSWVNASRFVGRCQWSSSGYSNDGYGTSGCTGDVAEAYETKQRTEPGDILMFDEANPMQLKLAAKTDSGKLAGVVSTSAGVVLTEKGPIISNGDNDQHITDTQTLLVLTGKAPVKVNLENGPIKVGDYITASSTPGVGMKADAGDQVVGIAMENFNSPEQGKIFALTDKSGSFSMLKDEMDKKINNLEERLSKLEELLSQKN